MNHTNYPDVAFATRPSPERWRYCVQPYSIDSSTPPVPVTRPKLRQRDRRGEYLYNPTERYRYQGRMDTSSSVFGRYRRPMSPVSPDVRRRGVFGYTPGLERTNAFAQ